MSPILAFFIGFLIGMIAATVGVLLVLSLCAAAKEGDTCREYLEAHEDQSQESEGEG